MARQVFVLEEILAILKGTSAPTRIVDAFQQHAEVIAAKKRQFCDRCGVDITNKRSSALSIVADADPQGNGTITKQTDLCQACRAELEHWIAGVRLAGETPRPRTKGKAGA